MHSTRTSWTSLGILMTLLLTASASLLAADDGEVKLETEEQKKIYAYGLAVGQDLAQFSFTDKEIEVLLLAIKDRAKVRTPRVNYQAITPELETYLQERTYYTSLREANLSRLFLDEVAKEEGAVTTESGLVLRTLRPGTGEIPGPDDIVSLNYEGRLHNGTVFDSTLWNAMPIAVAIADVMPCWSEAFQRMRVGEMARVVCPPDLAFGAVGQPPMVMPGAVLDFDIELTGIADQSAAEKE